MRLFALAFVLVSSGSVFAATPYKRSLTGKHGAYVRDGVFTGGEATGGSALLGMRRAYSAKAELERVIVDLGDKNAKPNPKQIGYFQVSMDAPNQRVVLDLAQLRLSRVSEQQVQRLFKKSAFVRSAELMLDPEDKTATLVLNLNRPMKLEVFNLRNPGKPARIVMDLRPLKPKRG